MRLAFYFSCVLVLLIVHQDPVSAEAPRTGDRAPTSIVASFISGRLSKEGKATRTCPTLKNREAWKIAVFAKQLDPNTLALLRQIDGFMAEKEPLCWSFAVISHENSPTPSELDWQRSLEQIQASTKEAGLTHLSVGYLVRVPESEGLTRARRAVGVFDAGDVVVALIRAGEPRPKGAGFGTFDYVESLNATDLDKSMVSEIMRELKVRL